MCQKTSPFHAHVVVCWCALQVVLTSVRDEQIAAVADCLASYPSAQTLCCLGCDIGDKVRCIVKVDEVEFRSIVP